MAREGGAYCPASLSGTYSRVPHGAIAEAHRRGLPNVWAVLLMLLSYTGEDAAGVWASCPQTIVCDVLGLTPNQVHEAVRELRRKGLIKTLRRGGNGRSSVYRLNVGGGLEPPPTGARTAPSKVGGGLEPPPKTELVGVQNPHHKELLKEVLIGTSSEVDTGTGFRPVPTGGQDYPPHRVIRPNHDLMKRVSRNAK